MKIKNIVGLGVALLLSLLVSVAVSAATKMSTGDVTVSSSQAAIPVYVESTDLDTISSFKAFVDYDSSKASLRGVKIEATETDDFGDSTSVGTAQVGDKNGDDATSVGWLAGKNYPISGKTKLVTLRFLLTDTSYDFSDIALRVDVINSEQKNIVTNNMSTLGSYVQFSVPKSLKSEVGGKGAIVGMGVQIGEDVYKDGTDGGLKYEEDGDNYVFTVVLKPTEKKTTADVSLVAFVSDNDADTANTAGLSTFVVEELKDVVIEKLS